MDWRRLGAKPFLNTMLTSHKEHAKDQSYVKSLSNFTHFIEENWNWIVVCVFLSNFSRPQWVNPNSLSLAIHMHNNSLTGLWSQKNPECSMSKIQLGQNSHTSINVRYIYKKKDSPVWTFDIHSRARTEYLIAQSDRAECLTSNIQAFS